MKTGKMVKHLESYGRLCTQIYDIDKPNPPADAYKCYFQECQKVKGSVLELMCGSGRFLVPLREQGIDIDGVDASANMLAACRVKLEMKSLQARLYQQFIEDLSLARKYHLIFIPAGSFSLVIGMVAVRQSLNRILKYLEPGGRLLLEIQTPLIVDKHPEAWKGFWRQRSDGATIVFSVMGRYDAKDKVAHQIHKYELFENGRLTTTELEPYAMRYYEKTEFALLLKEAGFMSIRAFKPFTNEPPDVNASTIIFRAYKPE